MSSILQDLSQLTVLNVFAHPDDEGFGSGGVLAMLTARGARVIMVCATNGEVGEISDPSLATPDNLGQVRQEEMRRAGEVIGATDLRFLDYRDSGMDGTEDNNHPDSLNQAAPEEVVEKIVALIRAFRPDVVMTHDPTGGYGHPDHIAIYRHTDHAFRVAGGPEFPNAGEPWTPSLLYYVCFPRSNFKKIWETMLELGIKPPFASEILDKVGSPDQDVTTVVDASSHVDTKIASLECHRTQIDVGGPFERLPQDYMREIMGTEYFTLAAYPPGDANADLFAQVFPNGKIISG
ncbi:MAG: hypothetical protein BZY75_00030 [SAR202 cluster bacterium Io17-Chloro-G7]|nr:MAG: hypothetical protein BZY75_00030 [SAR202 cluster bacterium Io17-Chloro-G7]